MLHLFILLYCDGCDGNNHLRHQFWMCLSEIFQYFHRYFNKSVIQNNGRKVLECQWNECQTGQWTNTLSKFNVLY